MRVREAQIEEVLAIARLMKGFEEETAHVKVDPEYTNEKYKSMMGKGLATLFVLETDEGEMVGSLGCIVGPDLHTPRIIAVETFWFVVPEHRGDGLMLMRYFEQWAKLKGCDAVAMIHMVDSSPDSLGHVYKRRGYTKIESHYLKEL
jgi:GNAT superfamily N-acetyltransferase